HIDDVRYRRPERQCLTGDHEYATEPAPPRGPQRVQGELRFQRIQLLLARDYLGPSGPQSRLGVLEVGFRLLDVDRRNQTLVQLAKSIYFDGFNPDRRFCLG